MKIKERTKAGVETEGRQAWRGRQAGERCHGNGIRSRAGSLRKRSGIPTKLTKEKGHTQIE